MATGRLGGQVVQAPVLGLAARWCGWFSMLAVLLSARAAGACAGRGRAVVLTVRQLAPQRSQRLRMVVFVATMPAGVVAFAAPSVLLLIGSEVSENRGAAVLGSVLQVAAAASFVAVAALTFACVAPALHAIAPGDRRFARSWAHDRGVVLVEVAELAATADSARAATVLVRCLLAHADRHHVAILARSHNERVAEVYKRLGFAPLPRGNGRTMLRPPRTRPPFGV